MLNFEMRVRAVAAHLTDSQEAGCSTHPPATKKPNMSTLTLTLKQKFADDIFSGDKTQEFREIRPTNANKYCEFDEDGELIAPKKYEAITFYVGKHEKDMPHFTIEVIETEINIFEDEETGELATFDHDGEEYIQSQVVYTLGKILNKHKC